MKIIISPAKKMRVDNDTFVPLSKPAFLDKTEKIAEPTPKINVIPIPINSIISVLFTLSPHAN